MRADSPRQVVISGADAYRQFSGGGHVWCWCEQKAVDWWNCLVLMRADSSRVVAMSGADASRQPSTSGPVWCWCEQRPVGSSRFHCTRTAYSTRVHENGLQHKCARERPTARVCTRTSYSTNVHENGPQHESARERPTARVCTRTADSTSVHGNHL